CARLHVGRGQGRTRESARGGPGRARPAHPEARRSRARELVRRGIGRAQADRARPAHLLDGLRALEDPRRVRLPFGDPQTKRGVIALLGRAERAEGAHIFIGSENKLFSLSGSSTIVAPYRDGTGRIVGVLGVIGPTRLNYARVIPMVDYTAKVVSKLIGA